MEWFGTATFAHLLMEMLELPHWGFVAVVNCKMVSLLIMGLNHLEVEVVVIKRAYLGREKAVE